MKLKNMVLLGSVLSLAIAIGVSTQVGAAPIHVAVKDSNLQMVQQLIDKGVDVNAVDDYENTALKYAANRGRTDIVNALFSAGAEVSDEYLSGNSRGAQLINNYLDQKRVKQVKSARK